MSLRCQHNTAAKSRCLQLTRDCVCHHDMLPHPRLQNHRSSPNRHLPQRKFYSYIQCRYPTNSHHSNEFGGEVVGRKDRLQLRPQSRAASCALLAWREAYAGHHLDRTAAQRLYCARSDVIQQPTVVACSGQCSSALLYIPTGTQSGCVCCVCLCVSPYVNLGVRVSVFSKSFTLKEGLLNLGGICNAPYHG